MSPEEERRTGSDRRSGTRRTVKDRRRVKDPRFKKKKLKKPGSLYSAKEVTQVQQLLSRVALAPKCPVCDGPFSLGPVERRAKDSVRQVWCADCGRGTIVTNCVLGRVMVVVAVAPLRAMLRSILSAPGHEVLEPPNTTAALDVHRENPADVVITDILTVTTLEGAKFIRQLRVESPDARTIFLAPRPNYRAADPAAAVKQDATRIVRMPFTREDLLQALKEARA